MKTADTASGSPTAGTAATDADADARFAAWLDGIATRTDDPIDGHLFQDLLDDDPAEQRAWFDFEEAITAAPNPPAPAWSWSIMAAALIPIVVAAVMIAWRLT